jgi:hypothetical protein
MAPKTHDSARATAARAFVRSLNILLKFARMYDFGHPRTARQYETAWSELRAAIGPDDHAGLLLAASGDQLLLDGTPLDSAAAEKSFARMLSTAGIASIHFSPKITQASLARFVRGFPTGSNTKPTQLAEQLKAALDGDPHVHVNEVCFVPADSAVAKTTVAAQLAARTLGMNAEQTDKLLNDPEKLLQLIVAAEGTKSGAEGETGTGGSGGSGSGGGPGTAGGAGWFTGPSGRMGSGVSGDGYGAGPQSGDDGSSRLGSPSGAGTGSGAPGGGDGIGLGSGDSGSTRFGGLSGGRSGSGASGGRISGGSAGGSGSGSGGPSGSGAGGSLPSGSSGGSGSNSGGSEGRPGSGHWMDALSEPSGGVVAPVPSGAPGGVGSGSANGADTGAYTGGVGLAGAGAREYLSGVADSPTGSQAVGGPAASTPQGSGSSASGDVAGGASGAGATQGPAGVAGVLSQFGLGTGPSARWTHASSGIRGNRSARSTPGSMAVETGLMTLHQDELQGILQMLSQMARTNDAAKENLDASAFQSRLSALPRRARFTVSQALAALAAQAPTETSDKPTLLKLAENIAVRFAIERYQRGDVKVDAVRQLLDEMSGELDGLRKILGVYEERMKRAGLDVGSHVDGMAQEFWSLISDDKRKAIIESGDIWCVPAPKIREHVEQLMSRGETSAAEKVLKRYASCLADKSTEARRQTVIGIAELAPTYAKSDEKLFMSTMREVGLRLVDETDSELQSLIGAAFVRLSQEAQKHRSFAVIQRSVEMLNYIESERPGASKSLRPRIGIENHLPEFIDESMRAGNIPAGLKDLLRRLPQQASEQIASRFGRVGFREDCELLVSMMEVLGPDGLDHLRAQLRHGNPGDAIDAVGILVRLDRETVERVLPDRLKQWKRIAHDRVVRQIAVSGAPDYGRLLVQIFDLLDSLVQPLAIDEIGMSGEISADMRLLRIAEGDLPGGSTEYLRLKSIEALGRLRTSNAEAVLRKVAEAKKAWRWANPSELRLVAAQALEKIDPEWARHFIPQSDLSVAELSIEILDRDPNSSAIRQRRYPRLRLERPVPATTVNLKENFRMEIPEMALGGGIALCEQSLHPGSVVDMRLNAGPKIVRAQAIVRDANTQARAFEVVDMELEERSKLRKLLVQLGNALKQTTSQERNRRGVRTIFTSGS